MQKDGPYRIVRFCCERKGCGAKPTVKIIGREASFALAAGEVVAITAPSGSSKSSLLRLLNRLDVPSASRALLPDAETAALDAHELRRRVGMVMQQAKLFPGTMARTWAMGRRCAVL